MQITQCRMHFPLNVAVHPPLLSLSAAPPPPRSPSLAVPLPIPLIVPHWQSPFPISASHCLSPLPPRDPSVQLAVPLPLGVPVGFSALRVEYVDEREESGEGVASAVGSAERDGAKTCANLLDAQNEGGNK